MGVVPVIVGQKGPPLTPEGHTVCNPVTVTPFDGVTKRRPPLLELRSLFGHRFKCGQ